MADGNGQHDESMQAIAQATGTVLSGTALVAIGKITAGPFAGMYSVTVGDAGDPDPDVQVLLTREAVWDMTRSLLRDPEIRQAVTGPF